MQFSSATYAVSETGPTATITVTRTGGSSGTVGVNYNTTDGTATGGVAVCTSGRDYIFQSGTLTFGNGVVSVGFPVPICNDAVAESNETVNLTLSAPTGGATLGTPNTAVLTITDNDAAGLQYYPLPNPVRLLDTRPGELACDTPGTPLTAGGTRTEPARIPCTGIPANAQVIVGNATVVNNVAGAGSGFITLYPSGATQPTVSNLNYVAGQIVPNAFTVGLGSGDGAFNIFASSSTHFIVDVTGYYSDQATDANGAGLLYNPLPNPIRLLDTRPGEPACDTPGTPLTAGGTRTEPARTVCSGVAANAQAIVGNATVVNTVAGATGGFITLFPSGATQPTVSNLNYIAGQVVPNAFTVGLGSGDGAFNIFASSSTHFIVDVTGYFAP